MTERKHGFLSAIRALHRAMELEGLSADGVAIVLPDEAFYHQENALMQNYGDQLWYANMNARQAGITIDGVRILAASHVAIRD